MAQKTDEDAEALKDQLDKLEEALEIANENGLLKKDPDAYNEIMNDITKALNDVSADPPKTVDARKNFSSAYFKFNEAMNSASFWWRFRYSYGGPLLLYLLGVWMFLFLSWIFWSSVMSSSSLFWVPSWAYLWGAIGGVLQGLWMLWQHVSDRCLRKHWFVWYIVLPLVGAMFGALMYLVFFAGFIVATGQAKISTDSFVMLLCALAGFSSRWAVEILDKLTTMIKISS